jgi:hypothetical protein
VALEFFSEAGDKRMQQRQLDLSDGDLFDLHAEA